MDFFHNSRENYERSLTLNNGLHQVRYKHQGTTYQRTCFASYPDKVTVIKLTADRAGSVSFHLRAQIPYLAPFGPLQRTDSITKGYLSGATQTRFSGNGRTGKVSAESDDILSLRGNTEHLNMIYEGRIKVIPYGGNVRAHHAADGNDWLSIEKADSAIVLLAIGTNYELKSSVFEGASEDRLKGNADPHDALVGIIEDASAKDMTVCWTDTWPTTGTSSTVYTSTWAKKYLRYPQTSYWKRTNRANTAIIWKN